MPEANIVSISYKMGSTNLHGKMIGLFCNVLLLGDVLDDELEYHSAREFFFFSENGANICCFG